jgi:hypothetical protein
MILVFVQNYLFCQEKVITKRIGEIVDPSYFEAKLSGELFLPDNLSIGSPYFIDDWLRGDVTFKTGKVIHNKWLRYDGLNDNLIWRSDSSFQFVKLDKKLISEFMLGSGDGSSKYFFRKIRVPSRIKNDTIELFAQVLENSEILSLYMIKRVIIEGHVADRLPTHIVLKQQLMPDPYYYLVVTGKRGLRFKKISRKTILSMFPTDTDKIKSILLQHNSKLKNEKELTEVVKRISIDLKKK